jgi:DNA-binding NarL/FixJ family response regulator
MGYFGPMVCIAAVRILLAEDDSRVRDVLTELIATQSNLALVGAVADAPAAADAAERETPDVAIVDVRMPGGGGAWATREIRKRSPSTRVLAFSGHADQRTVDEMLDAGAHGYLVKGSSITVILETIAVAAAA